MKIPVANTIVGKDEAKSAFVTIKSGWISMGEKVYQFEKKISKFVNGKYAVAVNTGTAALHLAVIVSDIKEGDEVLLPDITFASTAKVIPSKSLNYIVVECDPDTFNIDIKMLKKN